MAPDVSVPANFGRHHIGAPSHGNLTFNMKEGAPIKANSIILSLNSPVIDNLTTNLHMTSVDVEDFSREAVDCFIEASYTGELEEVNVGNFRDVNKMSHVFEVSWLVAKCQEFYVSYLGNLNRESSYDDILFAAEEAVFMLSALKKRNFLESITLKLNSTFFFVSQRDIILKKLLSDLETTTKFQLDACLEIAQSDVHILVQILLEQLERQPENRLNENSKYLLRQIDLNVCFRKRPDVHKKLFSFLEDMNFACTDDYQLVFSLFERKRLGEIQFAVVPKSLGRYLNSVFNLDDVFDRMSSDADVANLYLLFEGLWLTLVHLECDFEDDIIDKIKRLKTERGWSKLDHEYIDRFVQHKGEPSRFLQLVKNCEDLVHKPVDYSTLVTIHEYTGTQFLQEIIFKHNAFMFQLPKTSFAGKQLVFLLKPIENAKPESFAMSYYAADSIFHYSQPGKEGECQLPNLHFALGIKGLKPVIFPILWCGNPTRSREMNFWEWGYMQSSSTRPDDVIVGNNTYVARRSYKDMSKDATYRLICIPIT